MMNNKNSAAFEYHFPGLETEPFEFCHDIMEPSINGRYGGMDFFYGSRLVFMRLNTDDAAGKQRIRTRETGPAQGFRFCLSGRKKIKSPSLKDEICISPGQWSLFNFRDDAYCHQYRPNDTLVIILIIIAPDCFAPLIQEGGHISGTALSGGKISGRSFDISNQMTVQSRICLHQMLNCPYRGPAKRFYFEAKIMELIAHSLDQLRSNAGAPLPRPCDIDRMHHAARLLVQDVQNPPKLANLVRDAGTSRTKFFREFRQVHGVSPTLYLRCARMEKARQLLETGAMNITETANLLGFSCGSHFARTFKQHYGISPSLYHKKKYKPDQKKYICA